MTIKFFRLSIIMTLFCACQAPSDQQQTATDLKQQLPGTWESVSFKVTVNSANNSDSTIVFEIAEENWEQKLGTKPIQTSYYLDNKYKRLFRGFNTFDNDTLRGMWNTFSDTLMLIEPNATYQYQVNVQENGLAQFRTMMDWDGDGEIDDEYLGTERKVSKTPL